MNGKNAQQKVLSLLATTTVSDTLKVETIARQTNIGYHTAREALTKLRNANLVAQTNGFWSITPEGLALHTTNPNFSAFYLKSSQPESRENWAELLGPEIINSVLGRYILQEAPAEALERLLPKLRFFVLCWLRAEGIVVNFNALEEVLEITELEKELGEQLNNWT